MAWASSTNYSSDSRFSFTWSTMLSRSSVSGICNISCKQTNTGKKQRNIIWKYSNNPEIIIVSLSGAWHTQMVDIKYHLYVRKAVSESPVVVHVYASWNVQWLSRKYFSCVPCSYPWSGNSDGIKDNRKRRCTSLREMTKEAMENYRNHYCSNVRAELAACMHGHETLLLT